MTTEELTRAAAARISMFGYTIVSPGDDAVIEYLAGKVSADVSAFCNFEVCPDDIPSGLKFTVVDMIAGEFLRHKQTFAPESLSGLNLAAAIKQVTTGDTSTVFAVGEGSKTDEQRLSELIERLTAYDLKVLYRYRRVKW